MLQIPASAVWKRAPLFLTNWTEANAEWQIAKNADFVLKDGTTRAVFEAKVGALDTLIKAVDSAETQQTLLMAQRDALRASTHATMEMWRKAADYNVGGSPFGAHLPTLPEMKEAIDGFIKTLEEAAERWEEIDGATDVPNFTAPLVLKASPNAFELKISFHEPKQSLHEAREGICEARVRIGEPRVT